MTPFLRTALSIVSSSYWTNGTTIRGQWHCTSARQRRQTDRSAPPAAGQRRPLREALLQLAHEQVGEVHLAFRVQSQRTPGWQARYHRLLVDSRAVESHCDLLPFALLALHRYLKTIPLTS